MAVLTQEQIKQIAQELDCGFKCYWNRKNNELLFIPDEFKHPEMDTESWEEEMTKLENNPDDYDEIESLESRDSFEIMEQFIETLSDSNSLKNRLINALNKKKPFREFKFVIDNSGEYRQEWFDFKNQKLEEWVREKIEILKKYSQ